MSHCVTPHTIGIQKNDMAPCSYRRAHTHGAFGAMPIYDGLPYVAPGSTAGFLFLKRNDADMSRASGRFCVPLSFVHGRIGTFSTDMIWLSGLQDAIVVVMSRVPQALCNKRESAGGCVIPFSKDYSRTYVGIRYRYDMNLSVYCRDMIYIYEKCVYGEWRWDRFRIL